MGAEYISNALSTMIDQSSIKNIYSTSYCNSNYRNLYMRSKINSHDLIKVQDDFRINIGHSNFYEIKKGFFMFFNNHELFENTIVAASIIAKRKVRVLHHLSQSPDHPISIFHPEGEYLKGLVLEVE